MDAYCCVLQEQRLEVDPNHNRAEIELWIRRGWSIVINYNLYDGARATSNIWINGTNYSHALIANQELRIRSEKDQLFQVNLEFLVPEDPELAPWQEWYEYGPQAYATAEVILIEPILKNPRPYTG